ncbi:hypothetical protein [Mariniluteicoccus flavus]
MVGVLLAVTFACGLVIAAAHVINRRFIAPAYDVIANLLAFVCATTASSIMHEWVSAGFAAFAVGCWLVLARRTVKAYRAGETPTGQVLD